MWLWLTPHGVKAGFALMLVMLLLLCSGCATQSVQPSTPDKLPAMPQLREPLPSESYSKRVEESLSKWAGLLMGTSPTSKP